MRKRFLKQRHDGTLTALVLSGKPTEHLSEIGRTAREQIETLVFKMAPLEGVTERLKAENQMEGFAARTASSPARKSSSSAGSFTENNRSTQHQSPKRTLRALKQDRSI